MFIRLHFKLFGCYFILAECDCGFDAPMIHANCKWNTECKTVNNSKIMQRIVDKYNGEYGAG